MDSVTRFFEYAAAFERAFDTDEWSVLDPFFADDAVYEIDAPAPLGGKHEGRAAVCAHMKDSVNAFDRRFDERTLDLVEGPAERDGGVWMSWRVTYAREGAPDLVVEGEEIATFDGDRIVRLEDRYPAGAEATLMGWMEQHGDKLRSEP